MGSHCAKIKVSTWLCPFVSLYFPASRGSCPLFHLQASSVTIFQALPLTLCLPLIKTLVVTWGPLWSSRTVSPSQITSAESFSCVKWHSHRFLGLGCRHLWAVTLPSTLSNVILQILWKYFLKLRVKRWNEKCFWSNRHDIIEFYRKVDFFKVETQIPYHSITIPRLKKLLIFWMYF